MIKKKTVKRKRSVKRKTSKRKAPGKKAAAKRKSYTRNKTIRRKPAKRKAAARRKRKPATKRKPEENRKSMILFAGVPESGKDEIIAMVLKSHKKHLPKHRYINLSEVSKKKPSLEREITNITKYRDAFYQNVGKLISSEKRKQNIIINCCLTMKTEHGYFPLLPKKFFKSHSPDMIVFMEMVPSRPETYMMVSEHMDWTNQEINKNMINMYSALSDSVVKVIKIKAGNIKNSIEETAETLRFALR